MSLISVVWDLHDQWSSDAKWTYGTVLLQASAVDPGETSQFRVVIAAERHDSKNGFVAVDEFEFIENDKCLVNPPEADPNAPTPTPPPTEPPGRKFRRCLY